MTDVSVAAYDVRGRKKHLGELALIFRHRGGTWRDFGLFLEHLFGEEPGVGEMVHPPELREVACRHQAPGGRHAAILEDSVENRKRFPMFEGHRRYARPCVSIGTWEDGKNPGLVVYDLGQKAARFLQSIGPAGDSDGEAARDPSYEPDSSMVCSSTGLPEAPSPPDSNDMAPDSQVTHITDSNASIMDVDLRSPSPGEEPVPDAPIEAEDTDTDEPEGLMGELEEEGTLPPWLDVMLETPADFDSQQDSMLRSTRSTTKMRAATLAYLHGFADQPLQLREEFRRLRSTDMMVLHLCGCGMCYKQPDGTKVFGCAEHSHLRLGYADENKAHVRFHFMLEQLDGELYAKQAEIIHTMPHGEGVF